MSAYNAVRIEKPEFFRLAPLRGGRGKRVPYVIGFDSEADTRTGRPMLFQFSLPDDTIILEPLSGDSKHARGVFLSFIAQHCTNRYNEYLVYGWNLAYEFTQLFGDWSDEIKCADTIEMETTLLIQATGQSYRFDISVFNDKRYFATFKNKSTGRVIRLLDGMSFFKTSLGSAAKMLGLGEKYQSDTIDRTHFTRDDLTNPEFLRYAEQDAYITRRVGEHIVAMHEQYGITQTISAPHFASKVFRRRFLQSEIRLPDTPLEQAGLWSYHGGKNGFYLPEPTYLPDVYQYDITSAYPEAMRQLPDPTQAEFREVADYVPGRHAIYRVTLRYRRCKYRGMMTYDGLWPESGIIEANHITGYELDAMMERGECDILAINGWEMTGPPGGPLVAYVDEFFRQKATTTGPERETAKLFLNSLYGKFFQKVALGEVGWIDLEAGEWVETNPDMLYDWRAGGLYHPPIASLITGFVRAKIHGMEHKYDALMTSTDGIFATVAPDPNDLGKYLGGLTVKRGALRIWRERLYIFQPVYDAPCDPQCKDEYEHVPNCPNVPKWAAHGWRAGLRDLAAVPLARGNYEYKGRQMVTLKLSTKGLDGQRYEPGRFVLLPYSLNI